MDHFTDTALIDHYFPKLRVDPKLQGIRALFNLTLNFNSRLTRIRAQGGKIVGINGFSPTEAFYAGGLIPVGLGRSGVFNTILGGDNNIVKLAEENGLKRDNCLRLRGSLGSLIAGSIPLPDLIVCAGTFCDNQTKMSELLTQFAPTHYMDVPTKVTPAARQMMQAEYRKFLFELEKIVGQKIEEKDLLREVEIENKLRSLIQEMYRLMATEPPPLSGLNFYIAQLSPFDWLGNPQELLKVYRILIKEIKNRVIKGTSQVSTDRIRVIIAGNGTINFDLFDLIEDLGGTVVGIEGRYALVKNMIDVKGDIINNVAEWILTFPHRAGAPERFQGILEMVKQQKASGVIYNACWGCRHLSGAANIIQGLLVRENIPMIILDLANQNGHKAQIRTRLDAFFEMLSRKC